MPKIKRHRVDGFRGHALPMDVVRERYAQAASGAAGVHADQTTRRTAAGGRTNRVAARSAQLRAAVRDQSR